jgi:hypothetical protein
MIDMNQTVVRAWNGTKHAYPVDTGW